MELGQFDKLLEYSFLPVCGATLLLAMIRYPKYFDTSLRYFPILILYTFMNELLAVFVNKYDYFSLAFNNLYNETNVIIYNIYDIIFFLYFFYLYRNYVPRKSHKDWIKYSAIVFLGAIVVNNLFQSFSLEHQKLTYFTGALILIACIFIFLHQRTKKRKKGRVQKDILYWISMGLLIFHLGYVPIKIIRVYHAFEGIREGPGLRRLHLLLVLAMYAFFIIGFLRMKGSLSKKLG